MMRYNGANGLARLPESSINSGIFSAFRFAFHLDRTKALPVSRYGYSLGCPTKKRRLWVAL